MSRYIFDKNTEDRELGRLRLIEAAVDPDTIALAKLLNALADPSHRRVNEAICRMFENAGLDPQAMVLGSRASWLRQA